MYEQFGAREVKKGIVRFRLFHPDRSHCPRNCDGCVSPEIAEVCAIGTFQQKPWDLNTATKLHRVKEIPDLPSSRGVLYEAEVQVSEGFYDYRYHLKFNDGSTRWITDPCALYGGEGNDNSGFVVGGRRISRNGVTDPTSVSVKEIPVRLPYRDLIIYQIDMDDFTSTYRDTDSPLGAVLNRLQTISDLGFNAIEFKPWTGWRNNEFSWGYNPTQYFSVSHRLSHDAKIPMEKLSILADVINKCHQLDMHVIMDGVFNHAEAVPPNSGFGYYWMYQIPADSPFVGNFADAAFFRDLEYSHGCTLDFILDACRYWIDVFKIDGIRLDNTLGLYAASNRTHGLPALLSELRQHTRNKGIQNFSLILEHSWDYSAIDVTNIVGATSCWYDMFRSKSMEYLERRKVLPHFMRVIDAGREFQQAAVPTIYVENHDHKAFSLKASANRDEWWRMQPYLIALFTCAGAVLIHNGQEYGNSYDMPESGNGRVVERPINWPGLDDQVGGAIRALIGKLIEIRKDHPALRSNNFHPRQWNEEHQKRDEHGFGIDVDEQVVVYHRWTENAQGDIQRFYIVLNFSDDPAGRKISFNVGLPGKWEDILNGDVLTTDGPKNTVDVHVGRCWGRILMKTPECRTT